MLYFTILYNTRLYYDILIGLLRRALDAGAEGRGALLVRVRHGLPHMAI